MLGRVILFALSESRKRDNVGVCNCIVRIDSQREQINIATSDIPGTGDVNDCVDVSLAIEKRCDLSSMLAVQLSDH